MAIIKKSVVILLSTLLLVSCGPAEKSAVLETNKLACKKIQDVLDIARLSYTAKDSREQGAAMMVLQSKMNSGDCKSMTKDTSVLISKTEQRNEKDFFCIRTVDDKECRWVYGDGVKS